MSDGALILRVVMSSLHFQKTCKNYEEYKIIKLSLKKKVSIFLSIVLQICTIGQTAPDLCELVMQQDTVMYKGSKSRIQETSAFTNIPCGVCPVRMPDESSV